MILTKYTQPIADPVSLTAMKLHAKIDTTADDEIVKSLIKAATEWCEKYEGRSYMIRTYKAYLDEFEDEIYLPYPPLITVSSIQYVDSNGDTQTLTSSVYTVDTSSTPGRVYLGYNQTWPVTRDIPKAVTITYVAGYATTFTTAYATDTFTVGNAVFSDADIVRVSTDQGDLPASLAVDTDYHVRDVSGSTLKLAATAGGDAIDLSDDGTGTHYIGLAGVVPDRSIAAIKLLATHLYEHREAVDIVDCKNVPMGTKSLLSMEKVFR